jgi:CheY-like chemotaxis protein
MKYLVVDDSKLARLSLVKSLKSNIDENEAEIFQAENGAIAVEIVQNHKPDIVFLDLTMPVMDGYEALPKMKEIYPNIKVIVVSADIQEQAKTRVVELGAIFHVQKPINPQKMQDILEML